MPSTKRMKAPFPCEHKPGDEVIFYQAIPNYTDRYKKVPVVVSHFGSAKVMVIMPDGKLKAVEPDNLEKRKP